MIFSRTFLLAMLLNICSKVCLPDSNCGKPDILLEATENVQYIVSSDYANEIGPYTCTWIIQSSNVSYVIKFKMIKIITTASILCGSDQVIVRDGTSTNGRPLRIWCKNTQINETATSYSSSIHVQFLTSSNDFGDLMFIMSYWAAPQGQVIVAPVEFGISNFVLIVISIFVGVGFVAGAVYLYYREVKRQREIKKVTFKQKLGVRRQGISGASSTIHDYDRGHLNQVFKLEESSSPEETSFSFLSPTPTSVFSV